MRQIFAAIFLLHSVTVSLAFVRPLSGARQCSYRSYILARTPMMGNPQLSNQCRAPTTLYLSPEDVPPETTTSSSSTEDNSAPKKVTVEDLSPPPSTNAAVPEIGQEEEKPYPIDLPSPLLLATSIGIAIVSAGILFDLLGGNPSLGFTESAAISLAGIPTCLFLFYAAILKGSAETEEDDRKYG